MSASTRRRYNFRDYLSPRVLTMLALGFSSGVPFLLVGNTFSFWLRDEGTTLKAIGFISWVSLTYSFQFVWAPLLDRFPVLRALGLRRGWMLLAQCGVAAGLFAMAFMGTHYGLVALGAAALAVAFASATQDIAMNAWRIEIAADADELGLLTSAYTLAYRMAMIFSDSLLLASAQHFGWPLSYTFCGIAMGIGILATLMADEPASADAIMVRKLKEEPLWTGRGLLDAVVGPFIAFIKTHGAIAIIMLLAIALYRLPDFVRGPMVNPFFRDLGMSKDMIALSRATMGLASSLLGITVAGLVSRRIGLMQTLVLGAFMQGVGVASNALLIYTGTDLTGFMIVMGIDDFALGFVGIALVAYMSSLTSLGYTATQFALLSSAYSLTGKFFKGFSGLIVDAMTPHFGLMGAYAGLFVACGLMGAPSLLLFAWLERRRRSLMEPALAG